MGIPHGHKRKKNFRAGRGHAGRVGGGEAHRLAARQWNSNKGNNKHLYSSLESAKNVYTPFRLEKVNIWVGKGGNTVKDQLKKKTVESVSEQYLLNPTAPPPAAQTFP